jgi:hypothetical protein
MSTHTTTTTVVPEGDVTLAPAFFWGLQSAEHDANREVTRLEDTLAGALDSLERACADARRDLAAGRVPNCLGVVQGRGLEADRTVALLAAAKQHATNVAWLVKLSREAQVPTTEGAA